MACGPHTRRDGSQNSDPTLAWLEEGFVFCDWVGQASDDDSDPDLLIFYGGCKATHDKAAAGVEEKISQHNDSESDNSLSNLYEVKEVPKHMIRMTSHVCLVCELEAKTAAQLHEHMHHFHVGSDLYHCDCGGTFLTAQDL